MLSILSSLNNENVKKISEMFSVPETKVLNDLQEVDKQLTELRSTYQLTSLVLKSFWNKYASSLKDCTPIEKKSIYFELCGVINNMDNTDEKESKEYDTFIHFVATDLSISEKIEKNIRNASYSMHNTYQSINDLIFIG